MQQVLFYNQLLGLLVCEAYRNPLWAPPAGHRGPGITLVRPVSCCCRRREAQKSLVSDWLSARFSKLASGLGAGCCLVVSPSLLSVLPPLFSRWSTDMDGRDRQGWDPGSSCVILDKEHNSCRFLLSKTGTIIVPTPQAVRSIKGNNTYKCLAQGPGKQQGCSNRWLLLLPLEPS